MGYILIVHFFTVYLNDNQKQIKFNMKKKCITLLVCCLVLVSDAQSLNFEWVKQMRGSNDDSAESIAVDIHGNVYTTGGFRETVDFDPGTNEYNLTAVDDVDMFIQKLDADGNFVWAKQIAGNYKEWGMSIAIDDSGNVYTTGNFYKTVDFDPGAGVHNLTAVGFMDFFIQKLDPNGNFLWAKQFGSRAWDGAATIHIDADEYLYITGSFHHTIDFDPGEDEYELTAMYNGDIFIQKLDVDGNFIWAKQMGNLKKDAGSFITTDVRGNVYLTGHFEKTVDFDPGKDEYNLTSTGERDIFIQKLDSDGNLIWAKQMGGSDKDFGIALAIDNSENVYTIGHFNETADFDPGAGEYNFTSKGLRDVFIQKLDVDGNFIWAKQMGGINYEWASSITIDTEGYIYTYTAGIYFDTINPVPNKPKHYIANKRAGSFIQKLTTDGNVIWIKQLESSYGTSMVIDDSGNLYTTGNFHKTVDFDPNMGVYNLTAEPYLAKDIFVQKFSQCMAVGIDTQTACGDYTWIDDITYTRSNHTATFNIVGGAVDGCDSLVTLDLTIEDNFSDNTTSVDGSNIKANNRNATYQWLDCDNNYAPLFGATNRGFAAVMDGNYAVELTENKCVDTSACVLITTVGLTENLLEDKFLLFPNPTTGEFAISFDDTQESTTVRLLSFSGQLLESKTFNNTNLIELEVDYPQGIYMLEIVNHLGKKSVLKLLKI